MIIDGTNLINDIVADFNRGYEQGKKDAVVHAHWVLSGYIDLGSYCFDTFKCSNCSEKAIDDSEYCPHCGAKMDEEV